MKHLSAAHASTKLTLTKTLLLTLLMMTAGAVWLTWAPLTASQKLVTQRINNPLSIPRILCLIYLEQTVCHMHSTSALWFPRSRNRGQNRGIGQLKWNLCFDAEYRGTWLHFTEMLFSCGRGMYVWGKLHWRKQICGHNKPLHRLSPSSKQCKHGSIFVDIYPSVQSRAVPEQLVCVRWTVALKRSRPEKS